MRSVLQWMRPRETHRNRNALISVMLTNNELYRTKSANLNWMRSEVDEWLVLWKMQRRSKKKWAWSKSSRGECRARKTKGSKTNWWHMMIKRLKAFKGTVNTWLYEPKQSVVATFPTMTSWTCSVHRRLYRSRRLWTRLMSAPQPGPRPCVTTTSKSWTNGKLRSRKDKMLSNFVVRAKETTARPSNSATSRSWWNLSAVRSRLKISCATRTMSWCWSKNCASSEKMTSRRSRPGRSEKSLASKSRLCRKKKMMKRCWRRFGIVSRSSLKPDTTIWWEEI